MSLGSIWTSHFCVCAAVHSAVTLKSVKSCSEGDKTHIVYVLGVLFINVALWVCNVSIESYAATVHNTQCNALTGVKSWATCCEGGAKTRRLPLFTAFHRWEVFPPNSASNGAACSSSVTFARNYSQKYFLMPSVEKYFVASCKIRNSLDIVTLTQNWKLLVQPARWD